MAAWVAGPGGEVAGHVALVRGLRLDCLLRAPGLPPEALGGITRLSSRCGSCPPAPAVPGYQHVFLFYFENQDFHQIVGSIKQPIATSSGRRGQAVTAGAFSYPTGMAAIAGSTAIVVDSYGGQLSLFSTRTRHAYAPITVGNFPVALAITG